MLLHVVCHYFWVDVIPLLQNYDVQALQCCHHHLSEEEDAMRMHYYIIIDGVYAAMLWLLILQISSCWRCTNDTKIVSYRLIVSLSNMTMHPKILRSVHKYL